MAAYTKGRVRITYESSDGARELPFVIGVIGDFSGNPDPPLPRFRDRKFEEIHEHNFDAVMAKLRPRIALRVPNLLTANATELRVMLSFTALHDFEPERIAAQVEPLRWLIAKRALLATLRKTLHRDPSIATLVVEWLQGAPQAAAEAPPPAPAPAGTGGDALPRPADDGSDSVGGDLAAQIAALREIWVGPPEDAQVADLEAVLCSAVARIDELLNAQVNAILHHETVQRLEAAWCGLHYLVSACSADELLIVRVLSVSKQELARDLSVAAEFDLSAFWDKVYEEEYGRFGGEAFGVLIGDYEFDNHPDDIDLLTKIAGVAAAAHAPFIAAASPGLFGWDSFDAALLAPDIAALFRSRAYTGWNGFRRLPDSRYVGLTVPRILMRDAYRAAALPSAPFPFDEDVDGRDRSRFLFGNGAFALGVRIARAFAAYHWCAAIRGIDGGLVDDLACTPFPTDSPRGRSGPVLSSFEQSLGRGEQRREAARRLAWAPRGPVEVDLTSVREQQLAELGFIPIVHCQGTGAAVIYNTPSCQDPVAYTTASATMNARLSAQLQYILAASRFAHYLKVIMRDRIGRVMEREDCEREVNEWLSDYCLENPEGVGEEARARKPLRSGTVEVSDDKRRPGWYKMRIRLQPHFQLEELGGELHLVTDLKPERQAA